MVILLRLLALLIVLAAGLWFYQGWLEGRTPPTRLALPEKGVFPGPAEPSLGAETVERLHDRALGQRY
jgi:hypothetical protein